MKDRYVFLKTAEHNGEIVALFADREKLGDSDISAFQLAFRAHASPKSRAGILTMTAEQLQERLPELEKHEMTKSVAAFKRAIECIDKKSGHQPEHMSGSTKTPTRKRAV